MSTLDIKEDRPDPKPDVPEIAQRFKYRKDLHRPLLEHMQEEFVSFAEYLADLLPEGRYRAMALTSLEQALWAVRSAMEQDPAVGGVAPNTPVPYPHPHPYGAYGYGMVP